jgi:hypothetical protein
MGKQVAAGAVIIALTTVVLLSLATAVRFRGGPLQARPDPNGIVTGLHLPAGLPIGRPIYVVAPPPLGGIDATIERIEVEGASPGLRILRVFVVDHVGSGGVPDAGFWLGKPADGRVVEPPAAIPLRDCCEPQDAFAIELEVLDAGPHSIAALTVDYRAGLFDYRTSLPLGDWATVDLTPT